MDFSIITLILNILLIVFIGFGFLFGLRGLKKATKSLVIFIVAMFIVFLISPAITGLLLNIKIDGMAIRQHISSAVVSAIGEEMANQSFVMEIVKNFPNMIVNIITTFLLLIVVGLICKILVAILSKIFFKKEKSKEIEKCEIVNGSPQMIKVTVKPKKRRFLGGLVGAFKGFLVCLALFMPIIGLGNVLADIAGIGTVSAESNSETELKSIKQVVKEDLPKEVYYSVDAINNSFISKIGRMGNIGEVSLNLVAKCNINGQNVKLGQELKALTGTYDKFVKFAKPSNSELNNIEDIFADMMENPENYDFGLLDELLDELFNSNLINATGNDILIFVIDSISESSNESTKIYLSYLKTAIENYSETNNYSLKTDIKAFFDVFEISAKSGLLKAFQSEGFKLSDVCDALLNDADESKNLIKNKNLNDLSKAITSSDLLQKVAIESTNYGISELEKVLNNGLTFKGVEEISLKRIDSKNVSITSTELENLLDSTLKTMQCLENIDFEKIGEAPLNLFDYNIEGAIENAGTLLQIIADMEMFKQSGAYNSLCDAMSLSEINEYVNFAALKNTPNIKVQFINLSNSVKELKASGVMSSIKQINDNNLNEKLNVIASQLAKKSENVTYVKRIVTPLMACDVADNAVKFGLTYFEDYLQDIIMEINPEQEDFAKLNIASISTPKGKQEFILIFEKTVVFTGELQVFTMSEDKIVDSIINSGAQTLGEMLDSYKNSELFGMNSENKSAYIDFVTALTASELNEIFYFDVARADSFSWIEEMAEINQLTTNLNEIEVDGDKLIDYMIDGGDYTKIIDSLTKEDAVKLQPLFNSKLLYPMAINIINEINKSVGEFVGEDYANQIHMLTVETFIDLKSQSKEVVDVIAEAIDIDLTTLTYDNLESEQIAQINSLLSKMEDNAVNDGVFKDSYNALLLKMANIIVEEVKELVGEELGSSIDTQLSATTVVAGESEQLIDLLNVLLKNINALDNTEITKMNSTELIAVLDEFNNSIKILNGYFEQSFNSLLVYVVNGVNEEISYIVGKTFRDNINFYDNTNNIIGHYKFIKFVVESGLEILSNEDIDIDTINIHDLEEFLINLEACSLTRQSYYSLITYISNEMILNINALIEENNEEFSETETTLEWQQTDILGILKEIQITKPIIEEKGANILEYNVEEKTQLVKMLNAFQVNGNKANGVFRSTYISLIDYVAKENGVTSEMIKNNFASNNIIDWESFVNQEF